MDVIAIFLFVVTTLFVLAFFLLRVPMLRKYEKLPDDPVGRYFPSRCFRMSRGDAPALTLIVLIYAAVAFFGLGDTVAPQSFCKFQEKGQYALVEFNDTKPIGKILFYSGLHTGNYALQFSEDGETFEDVATMEQNYKSLFKWNTAEITTSISKVKSVRIISDAELSLGELAIYDDSGRLMQQVEMTYDAGTATLLDEQELVPDDGKTYMNSMYFDEIYHGRTAFENIENVYPYEKSHPPLGKNIMSVGILLFGMVPFGWRFMGTLFGVLMLPFMYIFLKNMFGSRKISVCGTLIFAFDFMHFVQTRIATIDSYAVFFILGMYFFMYRYVSAQSLGSLIPAWRKNLPLFLSGLFFGLGAASKWTVIYGAIGLALIWLINQIQRCVSLSRCGQRSKIKTLLLANISLALLFFIIIPASIYYLSYYPYGAAKGMSGIQMLLNREYFDIVIDNQRYMFNYHAHIEATHPYSSRWYQWVVDARPILYYLYSPTPETKSAIGAFLNPLLCWGGLVSMFFMGYLTIRKRDGRALFILLGYLSQLVPWMFISRVVFEYHYFPCTVFLTLGICHILNTIRRNDRSYKLSVYGYTAACILMFVLFYPVLSGATVPSWYGTNLLRWIPNAWPF